MTVQEAAAELDVLPETIRKYLRAGKLKGQRQPGQFIRKRRSKVEVVNAQVWVVNGRSVRGFLRSRTG